MISTTTQVDRKIRVVSLPNMPIFKMRELPYDWAEIKEIVSTNQLERLARSESESDRYLKFKKDVASQQLTVYKYLVKNQLKWISPDQESRLCEIAEEDLVITPKSTKMFVEADDLKVLRNDFPYNFERNVVHLCVWTKFNIPADPQSIVGDISPHTRAVIERYLKKTFVEKYGIEWRNLVWFKNWESLQSVKRLSHVHVIVYGMKDEALEDLLGGPGVPLTVEELESI